MLHTIIPLARAQPPVQGTPHPTTGYLAGAITHHLKVWVAQSAEKIAPNPKQAPKVSSIIYTFIQISMVWKYICWIRFRLDPVCFSQWSVIDIRTWVRSFVDCLHSNLAVSHPFYKFSFCLDRIGSGLAHLEVNNIGATKYFKFVNNDGPVPVPGPALLFRQMTDRHKFV